MFNPKEQWHAFVDEKSPMLEVPLDRTTKKPFDDMLRAEEEGFVASWKSIAPIDKLKKGSLVFFVNHRKTVRCYVVYGCKDDRITFYPAIFEMLWGFWNNFGLPRKNMPLVKEQIINEPYRARRIINLLKSEINKF